MSQREILTNGNAFKRTDGRWGGTVWYLDEKGERKRKSFSGTTKAFRRIFEDAGGGFAELAAGV